MNYKTRSLSLQKLLLQQSGIVSPLCNNCKTKDCTNLVENHRVSIFGANKPWRLIIKGSPEVVVSCEGFSYDGIPVDYGDIGIIDNLEKPAVNQEKNEEEIQE